jgi:hypothetical protein
MKLDTGTIIVGIAIIIFYLRFLQLKGRKKKEIRREEHQKMTPAQIEKAKKAKRYGAKIKTPEVEHDTNFHVTSWWLFGSGFLLACLGVAMKTCRYNWNPSAHL